MVAEMRSKGESTRLLNRILSMAALFLDQGCHATSMHPIADSAGIALAGIYNHFKSKEAIFEAIIVDQHPYKKFLPPITAAGDNTVGENIQHTMMITLNELGNEPYYINLMFFEIVEFNGKHGTALIKEIVPKILPIFEPLVKTKKDLRLTNPALLMRSFIEMILSYYLTDRLISDSMLNKLKPEKLEEAYVDIYLNEILDQKE